MQLSWFGIYVLQSENLIFEIARSSGTCGFHTHTERNWFKFSHAKRGHHNLNKLLWLRSRSNKHIIEQYMTSGMASGTMDQMGPSSISLVLYSYPRYWRTRPDMSLIPLQTPLPPLFWMDIKHDHRTRIYFPSFAGSHLLTYIYHIIYHTYIRLCQLCLGLSRELHLANKFLPCKQKMDLSMIEEGQAAESRS